MPVGAWRALAVGLTLGLAGNIANSLLDEVRSPPTLLLVARVIFLAVLLIAAVGVLRAAEENIVFPRRIIGVVAIGYGVLLVALFVAH